MPFELYINIPGASSSTYSNGMIETIYFDGSYRLTLPNRTEMYTPIGCGNKKVYITHSSGLEEIKTLDSNGKIVSERIVKNPEGSSESRNGKSFKPSLS